VPKQPLDAITDVPGIKVGHWTNRRAATGCTVVVCEAGAIGGVDVRGGAPGTIGTDGLRVGMMSLGVNAVLLTGGSSFGLAAAAGVMRWCEENGIGATFGRNRIPIVSGAVIFDLGIGRADVRPDAAAGYTAASRAKGGRVAEGSVGAGTGATVAKLSGAPVKGGIGTASETFGDGIIVGALAVVNAIGDIIDSTDGSVVAGSSLRGGGFGDSLETLRRRPSEPPAGNTTNVVVATNARLTREQANRLATIAHDGMARAIRPVHSPGDGDTVFALATGEREIAPLAMIALETFAALAVERAIVKGVRAATSLAGVPSVSDRGKRARSRAARPSRP
jgi:L-aminopeptidase/D-esterase-like protein